MALSAPTAQLAFDNGISATDRITNNGLINVSGVDAGARWQYSRDFGRTWINGTGSTFTMSAGSYANGQVRVRQLDANNVASPVTMVASMTIDVTPISVKMTADTEMLTLNNPTKVISLVFTDNPGNTFTAEDFNIIGGGTITQLSMTGSVRTAIYVPDPANGGSTVTISIASGRFTDIAGNQNSDGADANNTISFYVDVVAPAQATIVQIDTDTYADNAVNSNEDNDYITRDTNLVLTGTLDKALETGDVMEISVDNGATWQTLGTDLTLTSATTWRYVDPVLRTEGTVNYQIRIRDVNGNTTLANQLVSFDTAVPTLLMGQPILASADDTGVVGDNRTTDTNLTFNHTTQGLAEAGTRIALVRDVNEDGQYQVGVDRILGSATVTAEGTWSINVTLNANTRYDLAFVQWDVAGNFARMSETTQVEIVSGNSFVYRTTGGFNVTSTTTTAQDVISTAGIAAGIDQNGNLIYSIRSNVLTQTSATTASIVQNALTVNTDDISNTTFVDFNRDGLMDIVSAASEFGGNAQQLWTGASATSYTASRINVGAAAAQGGVVAYDKEGDGYLDFVWGSWGNNNANMYAVSNNAGTLAADNTGFASIATKQVDRAVSGVDINNDGDVDIAFHTNEVTGQANDFALTIFANNGSGSMSVGQSVANVFNNLNNDAQDASSMTWADFDNDGDMDLFVGRSTTDAGAATNTSYIYQNQNGNMTATGRKSMGDTLAGGASVAVDWDADGDMDIIELPNQATNANINLYTNTGSSNGTFNFSAATSLTTATQNRVSGAAVVDIDWDGDLDLIYSANNGTAATSNASSTLEIENTNQVADGTALHLRIVDKNGINSIFGNTVRLYDESGNLVASRILNAQSGVGTNDSTGLLHFYNLDPTQNYTAVLLRNVAGTAQDVGGVASISTENVEVVNTSWTGLVAGKATKNYVLTTEANADVNDSVQAGTGYNDTFYGTAGNDTFRGAGGWNKSFNSASGSSYSATQGMDVVDYKLATAAVTANLNAGTATGQGNDTLSGIEGLKGSQFNDVFTDSNVNNEFEGRGGNDTINLNNGGRDTVIFDLYDAKVAGAGNGLDSINNFTLANLATNANADVIDLRNLLKAYTGTMSVYWDATAGRHVLDQSSQGLLQYLKVEVVGANTVLSVDINGTGNHTAIAQLNGVNTSLANLIVNNQITFGQTDYAEAPGYVFIDRVSTSDTTPIIRGRLSVSLETGDTMSVTINAKTYSYPTGALVVDSVNKTWSVQLPNADALALGTYQVNAVVRNAAGTVIAQDITQNEVVVVANPGLILNATPAATIDVANKAVAMTMGENGQWRFFANGTMLDANGNSIADIANFSGNSMRVNQAGQFVGSATFMDFDRDGDMDLFGNDSFQDDGQQAYENRGAAYVQPTVANNDGSGNTGYYAFQVGNVGTSDNGNRVDYSGTGDSSARTLSPYAGIIAFDKLGDGFADLAYGDFTPGDAEAGGGKDSTIVLNNGSKLKGATNPNFQKDAGLVDTATTATNASFESAQALADKMISGVDLNNDGHVDLVYWASTAANKISNTATNNFVGTSTNTARLVVATSDGSNSSNVTANWQVTQIIENVFNGQMGDSGVYDGASMTWADFNGDGYLDLFQSSTFGGVNDTTTVGANNGWNSKIFFNDGTGKLFATTANATSGISTGFVNNDASKTYVFNDRMRGGGSVAVDWNADGKMDIIEIPYFAGQDIPNSTAQNVLLYTRNNNGLTAASTNAYDQTTLVNIAGSAASADAIRGLLVADVDWDGDKDAMFFTGNAGTTLVSNTNTVASGTALHLRILDQVGINSLIGNTVKLYSSTGQLVGTQIINPQAGNQTNDTSGIVDFYGLNANERYTAVLIRSIAGQAQNVGGLSSVGDDSAQNINITWKGLQTGAATNAYVLTAEADSANNNANLGNGIIGTGYNDTFFATLGNDKFEGAGGSSFESGNRLWSSTAGMDVVDYKLAGNAALNINLASTAAQNTGFGTQSFSNIEGVAGASGNDTFSDSSADNSFEGRVGNDVYNLSAGGRDTLVFDVYNLSDSRGGSGYDSANGFVVGNYNSTANADRIDLRGLLKAYTGTLGVFWDAATGRYQLDQASQGVLQYLKVEVVGSDTIISVDMNGTGNFSNLLKLNGVNTTLADLVRNEQIIRSDSTYYVEPATVIIDRQTTIDGTPIISGSISQNLQAGENLSVTVNGKTYSSSNGVVVVDPVYKVWHVQIPAADLIATGTYQVNAVIRNASNVVVAQDTTQNELKVIAASALMLNASTNTADALNKAVAMTMGENGQWRFYANGSIFDGRGTNLSNIADFNNNVLRGNQVNEFAGSGTFIDFDRDGDMDFFGQDDYFQDGYQAFEYVSPTYIQPSVANNTDAAGNVAYLAFQVGSTTYGNNGNRVLYSGSGDTGAHPYLYYGGFAAFDKIGDGYADFIMGDATPSDSEATGGKDSQIVQNSGTKLTNNTNPNFQKDPGLVDTATTGTNLSYESGQAQADKMVSSVDLNNDGAVDLVYWATTGSNKISNTATTTFTGTSTNANRMVVVSNDGTNSATLTANLQVTQIIENTMYSGMGDSAAFDGISMTWADFNNDGFLDLFMGTAYGTANDTTTVGFTNGFNSKIFFNDGTGKLAAIAANATSGISTGAISTDSTKTYVFNDRSRGGGSVAVDWNADGKMDIIETPFYAGANIGATTAQNVLLFTRNNNALTTSSNASNATAIYDQTTLINIAGTDAAADAITGLITADVDWDGDKDALFFTGNAGTTLVSNNNTVATGTSLHLRILDQLGANTLIGNTVKLFNAQGQLVATQIINPQAGNQTSDTSGIVDFYGLSASQTYTVVMHRNIGGASQDVGGVASLGGISVENVNAAWTGLKTGAATDAYVLTAEAGNANNNSTSNGIVGTGYNDTFFATLGTDKFEGGGGSSFVSGTRAWSNTGGMDIVDYKLAGSTAITANLSVTAAQNTGFGTQTLSNIEGLKGADGADTFSDSIADNSFEGRGGNDNFNLANGGHDTLIYKVLDASATGGNGADVVSNFFMAVYNTNANADRIDLSDLITAYNGPSNGVYINGVASISADSSSITNFVSTQVSAGNTQVFVDLDGTGSAYSSTLLLTINNVQTDLATLLANQQLIA